MNYKPVDMVKFSILSDDDYQRYTPPLIDLIKTAKLGICKDIISQIKKIIKSKSNSPPHKLRALKLLNSCMMVQNVEFLMFTQKKIMSRLAILASHRKELSLELRSESIFGKESSSSVENRSASIEFVATLLEYIKLWAGEFGKSPDKTDSVFYITYSKLKENGVRFPSRQVMKNYIGEEKKGPIAKKQTNFQAVENILKLCEENADESLVEDYAQMLNGHKIHVENALQDAMNTNNSDDIELLLGIMDRMTAALDTSNRRGAKKNCQSLNSSPGFKSQSSTSPPPSVFMSQKSEISSRQRDLYESEYGSQKYFDSVTLPNTSRPSTYASNPPLIVYPDSGRNSMFPSTQPNPGIFPSVKPNHNMFPSAQPNNSIFPPSQPSSIVFPPSITPRMFQTQPPNRSNTTTNIFPPQVIYSEKEKTDQILSGLKFENTQLKEALELAKAKIQEREGALQKLSQCNQELTSQLEKFKESLLGAEKKIAKFTEHEQLLAEAKKRIEIFENNKKYRQPVNKKEENKIDLLFDLESEPSIFKQPKKKLERRTTFDFSLDFILLKPNKLSNSQGPTSVLPHLFDSSSSSEDESQEVLPAQPANDLVFRMSNCLEMGILLDTETFQIGFRIQRQTFELVCCIFIGNKSSEPITEILTELVDVNMEAMPMIMQPLKTSEEILQNGQTTRIIKVQFISITGLVPKITVNIKRKAIQSFTIKLPLTIIRFIEGRQELPISIWMEWKKLVFEEDSCVVKLAKFSNAMEMCSFLCFGGAFRIYSQKEIQDLLPLQVLGAGMLSDNLVMFTVIVLENGEQANFVIRCRNTALRNAVGNMVKGQIISI